MFYQKFIRLIEDHADLLTRQWRNEIKNNPATPGYKNFSDEQLGTRIHDVYKRLGHWLSIEDPEYKETAKHFISLGRERAKEGLKSSEVIYALILSRVVLWKYVLNEGVIHSTFDMNRAFEFYQKVSNFFDKATYFVAIGFESYSGKDITQKKQDEFADKAVNAVIRWFMVDKK